MHAVCTHGSNNTNKLSPQERTHTCFPVLDGSNNTNKLSPQEPLPSTKQGTIVQIIQINLALKNFSSVPYFS